MDGILIIDKPEGPTSHDVVNRVRRILGTKKVGHTGTLDPFATGVLVLLVGKATRLAQFLDKDEKEYEAVLRFGFETDTGDKTGVQIAECGMRNEELLDHLARIEWSDVLSKFRGELQQIPPMYSAKKVDGERLYEHARKGVDVERNPIQINVRELELVEAEQICDPQSAIRIRVVCSAGTYIRTLAEDIGRAIGTGAHLIELRRTAAGKFRIEDAVTLTCLEQAVDPITFLRPLNEAVAHLQQFVLSDNRVDRTRNGLSTQVECDDLDDNAAVRMLDSGGELIAVGVYDASESCVRPKIVLL
jgi:tRNA pseudouridine55 synthase